MKSGPKPWASRIGRDGYFQLLLSFSVFLFFWLASSWFSCSHSEATDRCEARAREAPTASRASMRLAILGIMALAIGCVLIGWLDSCDEIARRRGFRWW